ncbi:MAG TPA: hypothetical protein VGS19_01790, partial [Streptosporangiaceae bacterium]|nr:hypothetical protein [Streptosporangiaceae bacterium]
MSEPKGRGAVWTEERGASAGATREDGASKRPAGERGPAASGATTLPAGLTVLASAEWPADESDALTPLPGFVVSS